MKILRIQFQNLNSLPSGDVNLQDGPLAQAGIFAITGPTGAGKSTILDAITLALYGRAARYGTEPNPGDMMSRRAGECQAEVLFEVPTGKFIARWERRKARNNPGGKLQAAKRWVLDENGTVLAEKVGDADALIEKLTGLDCARFLRSVMLAQGEFAQFFKASNSERAALLESLTGTQIYSELGMLAFEEFTKREQAQEAAETALGRIVLLTEEERAAKASEVDRLNSDLSRLSQERTALAQQLEAGRQLVNFLEATREVALSQTALEGSVQAAAPDLEQLARHRLAEPFVPHLQTLDDLKQSADRERKACESANAAADSARESLQAALLAGFSLGDELLATAREGLAEEQTAAKKTGEKIAALDGWISEHAIDSQLDSVFPELAEQLAALAASRNHHDTAVRDGRTLIAERESLQRESTKLADSLGAALQVETRQTAAVDAANDSLAKLLQGRTVDELLGDAGSLSDTQTALIGLRTALEHRDAIVAEGMSIAADEAQLLEDLEIARNQKAATANEAENHAKLLELTRSNLELLRRISDFESHRTQLKPGEPCPLCGALKHPFSNPGANPSEAIQEAERNLATAQIANTAAVKEAELATALLVRTEEALKGLNTRHGKMREAQMRAHEEFERRARTLRIFTAEALTEAIAANVKAKEDHEALTGAIRSVEKGRTEARLSLAKQQAEIAALRATTEGKQTALEQLAVRIASNTNACDVYTKEIAQRGEALTALLVPFGIDLPKPGEEPQTRQALEKRRKTYAERIAEQRTLQADLLATTARIEKLGVALETLRDRAARIVALSGELSGDAVNSAGKELGQVAAAFRTKWQRAKSSESGIQSDKPLQEAERELELLRAELTRTAAAAGERQKSLNGVHGAVTLQEQEFEKRLAGSAFANAEALRASRLTAERAARIEELKSTLNAQKTELAGRLTQLQEQIAVLRQIPAPEGAALDELALRCGAHDLLIAETTESRAALRGSLATDEKTRLERSEAAAALAEMRERLAIWAQMRTLVGSFDGAKFRQFAQGLSLDILVRHANRHLRRLSDRYQLQRVPTGDLMLEITDLHQANATRPMPSLSGGESFLASLALALGLSDLAGRNVQIDSLFIDEGFGSLDAETLDTAVAALDALRLNNKTVGVISHVELLKERIPVQIRVEKLPGGVSVLHCPGVG